MREASPGGGFGGMMSGMRGLQSGGVHSPNMDNLTDEAIAGRVYDHRVVARLARYAKPYKRDVLISIAGVLLYTVGNVTIPLLMMLGINWAINDGDMLRLHVVGGGFVAVALMHFAANYTQLVFMPKVGQGILYSLRTGMFNHLQSLSPSFFHRTPVGRIMSRSQSDVLQLQETFELIVQSFSDVLILLGIVTMMLIIDWQLALVTLSIVPVLFVVLGYWQRFARHSFMRIRRAIAMVNGEYNQNITGVRVVESLNRQQINLEHFDTLNSEHLNANLEASRFFRRPATHGGNLDRHRHGFRSGVSRGHAGRGRGGGVGGAGGLCPVDPALLRTHPPPDDAVQPVAAGHGGGSPHIRGLGPQARGVRRQGRRRRRRPSGGTYGSRE